MPGRKTWTLGRLVITTVRQAQAAPIVDRAYGHAADGSFRFRGRAIRAPWRGGRPSLALVFGWKVRE